MATLTTEMTPLATAPGDYTNEPDTTKPSSSSLSSTETDTVTLSTWKEKGMTKKPVTEQVSSSSPSSTETEPATSTTWKDNEMTKKPVGEEFSSSSPSNETEKVTLSTWTDSEMTTEPFVEEVSSSSSSSSETEAVTLTTWKKNRIPKKPVAEKVSSSSPSSTDIETATLTTWRGSEVTKKPATEEVSTETEIVTLSIWKDNEMSMELVTEEVSSSSPSSTETETARFTTWKDNEMSMELVTEEVSSSSPSSTKTETVTLSIWKDSEVTQKLVAEEVSSSSLSSTEAETVTLSTWKDNEMTKKLVTEEDNSSSPSSTETDTITLSTWKDGEVTKKPVTEEVSSSGPSSTETEGATLTTWEDGGRTKKPVTEEVSSSSPSSTETETVTLNTWKDNEMTKKLVTEEDNSSSPSSTETERATPTTWEDGGRTNKPVTEEVSSSSPSRIETERATLTTRKDGERSKKPVTEEDSSSSPSSTETETVTSTTWKDNEMTMELVTEEVSISSPSSTETETVTLFIRKDSEVTQKPITEEVSSSSPSSTETEKATLTTWENGGKSKKPVAKEVSNSSPSSPETERVTLTSWKNNEMINMPVTEEVSSSSPSSTETEEVSRSSPSISETERATLTTWEDVRRTKKLLTEEVSSSSPSSTETERVTLNTWTASEMTKEPFTEEVSGSSPSSTEAETVMLNIWKENGITKKPVTEERKVLDSELKGETVTITSWTDSKVRKKPVTEEVSSTSISSTETERTTFSTWKDGERTKKTVTEEVSTSSPSSTEAKTVTLSTWEDSGVTKELFTEEVSSSSPSRTETETVMLTIWKENGITKKPVTEEREVLDSELKGKTVTLTWKDSEVRKKPVTEEVSSTRPSSTETERATFSTWEDGERTKKPVTEEINSSSLRSSEAKTVTLSTWKDSRVTRELFTEEVSSSSPSRTETETVMLTNWKENGITKKPVTEEREVLDSEVKGSTITLKNTRVTSTSTTGMKSHGVSKGTETRRSEDRENMYYLCNPCPVSMTEVTTEKGILEHISGQSKLEDDRNGYGSDIIYVCNHCPGIKFEKSTRIPVTKIEGMRYTLNDNVTEAQETSEMHAFANGSTKEGYNDHRSDSFPSANYSKLSAVSTYMPHSVSTKVDEIQRDELDYQIEEHSSRSSSILKNITINEIGYPKPICSTASQTTYITQNGEYGSYPFSHGWFEGSSEAQLSYISQTTKTIHFSDVYEDISSTRSSSILIDNYIKSELSYICSPCPKDMKKILHQFFKTSTKSLSYNTLVATDEHEDLRTGFEFDLYADWPEHTPTEGSDSYLTENRSSLVELHETREVTKPSRLPANDVFQKEFRQSLKQEEERFNKSTPAHVSISNASKTVQATHMSTGPIAGGYKIDTNISKLPDEHSFKTSTKNLSYNTVVAIDEQEDLQTLFEFGMDTAWPERMPTESNKSYLTENPSSAGELYEAREKTKSSRLPAGDAFQKEFRQSLPLAIELLTEPTEKYPVLSTRETKDHLKLTFSELQPEYTHKYTNIKSHFVPSDEGIQSPDKTTSYSSESEASVESIHNIISGKSTEPITYSGLIPSSDLTRSHTEATVDFGKSDEEIGNTNLYSEVPEKVSPTSQRSLERVDTSTSYSSSIFRSDENKSNEKVTINDNEGFSTNPSEYDAGSTSYFIKGTPPHLNASNASKADQATHISTGPIFEESKLNTNIPFQPSTENMSYTAVVGKDHQEGTLHEFSMYTVWSVHTATEGSKSYLVENRSSVVGLYETEEMTKSSRFSTDDAFPEEFRQSVPFSTELLPEPTRKLFLLSTQKTTEHVKPISTELELNYTDTYTSSIKSDFVAISDESIQSPHKTTSYSGKEEASTEPITYSGFIPSSHTTRTHTEATADLQTSGDKIENIKLHTKVPKNVTSRESLEKVDTTTSYSSPIWPSDENNSNEKITISDNEKFSEIPSEYDVGSASYFIKGTPAHFNTSNASKTYQATHISTGPIFGESKLETNISSKTSTDNLTYNTVAAIDEEEGTLLEFSVYTVWSEHTATEGSKYYLTENRSTEVELYETGEITRSSHFTESRAFQEEFRQSLPLSTGLLPEITGKHHVLSTQETREHVKPISLESELDSNDTYTSSIESDSEATSDERIQSPDKTMSDFSKAEASARFASLSSIPSSYISKTHTEVTVDLQKSGSTRSQEAFEKFNTKEKNTLGDYERFSKIPSEYDIGSTSYFIEDTPAHLNTSNASKTDQATHISTGPIFGESELDTNISFNTSTDNLSYNTFVAIDEQEGALLEFGMYTVSSEHTATGGSKSYLTKNQTSVVEIHETEEITKSSQFTESGAFQEEFRQSLSLSTELLPEITGKHLVHGTQETREHIKPTSPELEHNYNDTYTSSIESDFEATSDERIQSPDKTMPYFGEAEATRTEVTVDLQKSGPTTSQEAFEKINRKEKITLGDNERFSEIPSEYEVGSSSYFLSDNISSYETQEIYNKVEERFYKSTPARVSNSIVSKTDQETFISTGPIYGGYKLDTNISKLPDEQPFKTSTKNLVVAIDEQKDLQTIFEIGTYTTWPEHMPAEGSESYLTENRPSDVKIYETKEITKPSRTTAGDILQEDSRLSLPSSTELPPELTGKHLVLSMQRTTSSNYEDIYTPSTESGFVAISAESKQVPDKTPLYSGKAEASADSIDKIINTTSTETITYSGSTPSSYLTRTHDKATVDLQKSGEEFEDNNLSTAVPEKVTTISQKGLEKISIYSKENVTFSVNEWFSRTPIEYDVGSTSYFLRGTPAHLNTSNASKSDQETHISTGPIFRGYSPDTYISKLPDEQVTESYKITFTPSTYSTGAGEFKTSSFRSSGGSIADTSVFSQSNVTSLAATPVETENKAPNHTDQTAYQKVDTNLYSDIQLGEHYKLHDQYPSNKTPSVITAYLSSTQRLETKLVHSDKTIGGIDMVTEDMAKTTRLGDYNVFMPSSENQTMEMDSRRYPEHTSSELSMKPTSNFDDGDKTTTVRTELNNGGPMTISILEAPETVLEPESNILGFNHKTTPCEYCDEDSETFDTSLGGNEHFNTNSEASSLFKGANSILPNSSISAEKEVESAAFDHIENTTSLGLVTESSEVTIQETEVTQAEETDKSQSLTEMPQSSTEGTVSIDRSELRGLSKSQSLPESSPSSELFGHTESSSTENSPFTEGESPESNTFGSQEVIGESPPVTDRSSLKDESSSVAVISSLHLENTSSSLATSPYSLESHAFEGSSTAEETENIYSPHSGSSEIEEHSPISESDTLIPSTEANEEQSITELYTSSLRADFSKKEYEINRPVTETEAIETTAFMNNEESRSYSSIFHETAHAASEYTYEESTGNIQEITPASTPFHEHYTNYTQLSTNHNALLSSDENVSLHEDDKYVSPESTSVSNPEKSEYASSNMELSTHLSESYEGSNATYIISEGTHQISSETFSEEVETHKSSSPFGITTKGVTENFRISTRTLVETEATRISSLSEENIAEMHSLSQVNSHEEPSTTFSMTENSELSTFYETSHLSKEDISSKHRSTAVHEIEDEKGVPPSKFDKITSTELEHEASQWDHKSKTSAELTKTHGYEFTAGTLRHIHLEHTYNIESKNTDVTVEVENRPIGFETTTCEYCNSLKSTTLLPKHTSTGLGETTEKTRHTFTDAKTNTDHSAKNQILKQYTNDSSTTEVGKLLIGFGTTPCEFCHGEKFTSHTPVVKSEKMETHFLDQLHTEQHISDEYMNRTNKVVDIDAILEENTRKEQTGEKTQPKEATSTGHKAQSDATSTKATKDTQTKEELQTEGSQKTEEEVQIKSERTNEVTQSEQTAQLEKETQSSLYSGNTTKEELETEGETKKEETIEVSEGRKPIIIIVNNSKGKHQKLNKSFLEYIISTAVPHVEVQYVDLNLDDGEKVQNETTELYKSYSTCNKTDFESGKNCFCYIQGYLETLTNRIANKKSIESTKNYCESYIKLENGLQIHKSIKPAKRERRGLIYMDNIKNKGDYLQYDNNENIFDGDFHLALTDKTLFHLPTEDIRIPCSNRSENTIHEGEEVVWKFYPLSSTKGELLPEKSQELFLHEISVKNAGNYTCSSENQKDIPEKQSWHELELITFPIYHIVMNIFYEVNDSCDLQTGDILHAYLPKIASPILCTDRNEVCSIQMERPRCITREDNNYFNVTMRAKMNENFVLKFHDGCDTNCKLRFYENIVNIIYRNSEIFERIPVHSHLEETRDANFKPHLDGKEGSPVIVKSPKIIVSCPDGFGLESRKQRVCVVCPAQTFSNEDEAFCRKCPGGQYQPNPGSKSCLQCSSPVDDKMCLRMLYSDTKLFKIYVGVAFGFSVLMVIVIVVWTSGINDSRVTGNRYEGSLRHRAAIGRKGADLEIGVNEPLLRQSPKRIPPQLPPVDF